MVSLFTHLIALVFGTTISAILIYITYHKSKDINTNNLYFSSQIIESTSGELEDREQFR